MIKYITEGDGKIEKATILFRTVVVAVWRESV
jgi:hypothetical protein